MLQTAVNKSSQIFANHFSVLTGGCIGAADTDDSVIDHSVSKNRTEPSEKKSLRSESWKRSLRKGGKEE